jgi:hypothetical protein
MNSIVVSGLIHGFVFLSFFPNLKISKKVGIATFNTFLLRKYVDFNVSKKFYIDTESILK